MISVLLSAHQTPSEKYVFALKRRNFFQGEHGLPLRVKFGRKAELF